jgi:hypothetical protein
MLACEAGYKHVILNKVSANERENARLQNDPITYAGVYCLLRNLTGL